LRPDFRTGFWAIEGKGGKISLPNQPEVALKDLGLRWKGNDLFVDRCALGVFKEGHVDGKGEIGFESPGRFDLELELSAIDIDELVQGEWRDRLAGTIHGPVRITGAPGALVYEGTMQLDEGVVEAMPVLKRIAQYTRSERFERLVLNQAKTDFKREGDRLELRNLILQSDGLVRIEGQADLVGDQLAGDFRIGVAPGTMRWIPGAERLVFTEDREGFLWTPMKLTGTLAEPKEDLSARLIAAAGEAVISELPTSVLDAAQEMLKGEGGKPASGDLIDQGKKVIDLLSPFLKAP
jgi:autotransporter translocation and assembly factor TamB